MIHTPTTQSLTVLYAQFSKCYSCDFATNTKIIGYG